MLKLRICSYANHALDLAVPQDGSHYQTLVAAERHHVDAMYGKAASRVPGIRLK